MKKIFYTLFVLVTAVIMMIAFTVSVNANEQWEQTGNGTVYYAVFPSGYNTGSALYGKYNGKRIEAYQNSETKREVATTQSGWVYWHWTFNNQALPNANYNVFISDHKGWDEGRNYIYFSDFESSANFPEQDKYGNKDKTPGVCFYHWRNIVSDGSWWWFRIPVYKQTYTEYKKVQSQNNPTGDDSSLNNNSSVNQSPAEGTQQSGGALSDATVTHVDIPDCVYNGKNRKPKVSVICNGKILVEGVDFSVEYKNCKKIGKATVIIKGCGNYSGTIKKHYKIVPKGTSIKKCSIDKKRCTVRWKKKSKNCNGYIIRYSTDSNFANCKKKVIQGKNKTKCTIKGLAAGTTYYIQICTYKKIGKKKYCSGWSKCKTTTTKKLKSKRVKKQSKIFSTSGSKQYRIIKHGNKVYFGIENRLVSFNLKTKKVKTLAKTEPDYRGITNLCVKNNYIYFYSFDGEDFTYASLYRVKLNGKEQKTLHSGKASKDYYRFHGYVMKDKRIYLYQELRINYAVYSMNYDGSDKRTEWCGEDYYESRRRFPSTDLEWSECNVKGYKMIEKYNERNNSTTVWISTPKGKIKAGSYKGW